MATKKKFSMKNFRTQLNHTFAATVCGECKWFEYCVKHYPTYHIKKEKRACKEFALSRENKLYKFSIKKGIIIYNDNPSITIVETKKEFVSVCINGEPIQRMKQPIKVIQWIRKIDQKK